MRVMTVAGYALLQFGIRSTRTQGPLHEHSERMASSTKDSALRLHADSVIHRLSTHRASAAVLG